MRIRASNQFSEVDLRSFVTPYLFSVKRANTGTVCKEYHLQRASSSPVVCRRGQGPGQEAARRPVTLPPDVVPPVRGQWGGTGARSILCVHTESRFISIKLSVSFETIFGYKNPWS